MHAAYPARRKNSQPRKRSYLHRACNGGRAPTAFCHHCGEIIQSDFFDWLAIGFAACEYFKLAFIQADFRAACDDACDGWHRLFAYDRKLTLAHGFDIERMRKAVRYDCRFERDHGFAVFDEAGDSAGDFDFVLLAHALEH
jgi:hypothetical protein